MSLDEKRWGGERVEGTGEQRKTRGGGGDQEMERRSWRGGGVVINFEIFEIFEKKQHF